MTALALCAMATMGATAANAMTASADGCTNMATQVKTALDANSSSSNYSAAMKEKNNGRDFCNSGMYKVGIDHYAQALKLLGVSAS
jgi:hypothetical protein